MEIPGGIAMINPFIIGKDVYLRPLRPEDAAGGYPAWLNDPDVCRFNSHHMFPYTPQQALQYITHAAGARDAIILAVCLISTDRHIGNISLQKIDLMNRSAEFAVLFGDKENWGKGYARQAAFLICEHGFRELGLHRLYCGTSAENTPMQKLAAAIGMREEGRRAQALFKHGRYVDVIEYGMLAADFEAGRGAAGGK